MVRWDDELVAQIYTQADRQEDQTNGARSLEHFDEFWGNFERSSVEFWKSLNALKGAWGNLERSLKEAENELEENLRRLKKKSTNSMRRSRQDGWPTEAQKEVSPTFSQVIRFGSIRLNSQFKWEKVLLIFWFIADKVQVDKSAFSVCIRVSISFYF